jgi:hypothetical protein
MGLGTFLQDLASLRLKELHHRIVGPHPNGSSRINPSAIAPDFVRQIALRTLIGKQVGF